MRSISLVGVLAALLFAAPNVAAQTATPVLDPAKITGAYKAPRTYAGRPDLQGAWTNASVTRMERPAGLPLELTPEQAAKLESGALFNQRSSQKDASFVDPDVGAPEKGRPLPPVGNYDVAYTDPGSLVANINGSLRSSYITFPENGRIPAMTDEGKKLRAAALADRRRGTGYDNPEERGLSERCLIVGTGGPPLGNYLYNNNFRIVQTADNVVFEAEMIHDVRIFRVNQQHRKDGLDQWMGDSVARWEGDTLVVETAHINAAQRAGAVFLSKDAKVTEKFTRISDKQILYDFEINDPAVYTSVWRGQMALTKLDSDVFEYACHEGNYALLHILKGGREDDRKGVKHTGGASRGE